MRGSVLLEAILALVIFMIGTAGLVSLVQRASSSLNRAELESHMAPHLVGIPIRALQASEGVVERTEGALRWSLDGDSVEVEFMPSGSDTALLRWWLPRAEPRGERP